MIEDENESGNLVEVRRARAPSLILPSPTDPALLPPHSRSLGSSRPASSPSTRPRQLPAVQASLPLTEQAKCRDFWHVLAARDEPAAPVVVVCCCITLCLSLCGSLWWCGVCRRGRSEWRSECAVTFHRVCMVWGHVYYDSKHSDSPAHVSTKQGHLWRKQLVLSTKTCGWTTHFSSGASVRRTWHLRCPTRTIIRSLRPRVASRSLPLLGQ